MKLIGKESGRPGEPKLVLVVVLAEKPSSFAFSLNWIDNSHHLSPNQPQAEPEQRW